MNSERMEVGEVIDTWDDVETEPESSSTSSEGEDLAAQEFEADFSNDDNPSTSAGPSTPASTQPSRPATEQRYGWTEITESK